MAGNISCGEALAGLLEEYGVDTIFGIPGVHTLELYKGLATSGLRHVLARHEQGLGFMADGYARASGRPGVCFVITGPGVTNIATAMGQAYSDSVPMLVVSSVNASADLGKGRGRLHEVTDQQAMIRSLTGASYLAGRPDETPEHIARAFESFATRRPRPVHVAMPLDILAAPTQGDWTARQTSAPPPPDPAPVQAARTALERAKRPVIIAGGGAVDAAPELTALAESTGAVVVTSAAGKGVVAESHPLSLGATLSLEPVRGLLAEADLILVVGSELSETDTWREDPLSLGGTVIRVDVDPAGGNMQPDIAITAHAATFAAAMDGVRSNLPGNRQHARVTELRARIAEKTTPLQRMHMQVLDVLRAVLPADGFVATDMTQIAYTGNHTFPVERPRCWFHPSGFGTLGYALPAAIGAMLGAQGRPGVALAGDYGFQFTMQELATAVELRLPLPVLLWNNQGLGQIRDDMNATGMAEIGVNAHNPDFQALARSFGCAAVAPASVDELGAAIATALGAAAPTLIEIRDTMPDLQAGSEAT